MLMELLKAAHIQPHGLEELAHSWQEQLRGMGTGFQGEGEELLV